MMKNKIIASAVSAVLFSLAHSAHATNGDQMLGITATQWGMGGATVAAPQDAATIMYNPAGLAALGIKDVRFDMGVGVLNPPRQANDQDSDSEYYLMPAGAAAFNVNDRLFLGMTMGGISGSGVDFPDVLSAAPNAQAVVTTKQSYKIAPGFGYKVNDQLSVGAALQIGYQSLAMYNGMNPAGVLTLPQTQVYGAGLSAGLIYKVNDAIQLGANWTSKTNMDEFKWNTNNGTYRMTMDMPQTLALGMAFKPMPGLLIAADVKHIGFSDVLDKVAFQTPAGASTMNFGWSDQTVFAIGVQKDVDANTTLRAGFNYGKSPIGAEDVNTNIGSLAITEKHLSLGVTRKFSEKVSASLSYAHAFQNEITSNTAPYNKIELEQNIVNLQLSYKY
jgi:long-chain fatty acid transport protein